MWVVALKERGEFEGIRDHLETLSEARYKRITTGTGGEILEAPADSGWPHLALVTDDPHRVRAVTQWLNRNLQLRRIISSGLVTPLMSEATTEVTYFMPSLCVRSAGRIDIGSPVLFEELHFDREIQREFTQTLVKQPVKDGGRIFGADRTISDAETQRWIHANLNCQAADTFTAELLLAGKRFGLRVGCLKVFENGKDPIRALQEAWANLIVS